MDPESNKRLDVFQSGASAGPNQQSSTSRVVNLEATQPLPQIHNKLQMVATNDNKENRVQHALKTMAS